MVLLVRGRRRRRASRGRNCPLPWGQEKKEREKKGFAYLSGKSHVGRRDWGLCRKKMKICSG